MKKHKTKGRDMKKALLFPGQGSQTVGMGKDLGSGVCHSRGPDVSAGSTHRNSADDVAGRTAALPARLEARLPPSFVRRMDSIRGPAPSLELFELPLGKRRRGRER